MQRRLLMAGLFFSMSCSGSGSHKAGTPAGTGGEAGGGSSGSGGAAGGSTGGAGRGGGGGSASGGASGGAGGMAAGGAGGTAAGGRGGSAGTGGAGGMAMGGMGGMPAAGGNSVLERNAHASRDGHFLQPGLTRAKAATFKLDANFKAMFNGQMTANPLYLENGPGGKGVFFAVTTDANVFALDETTGAVVWMKNVGAAAMGGCGGSMHKIGIMGTPVIDAQAGTIYLDAGVGANTLDRHEVHALSVMDGSERAGWPVDVTKLSASGRNFVAAPQNQRSALSLLNGILYVPYGGHVGDCGPYHGWVVSINTKNPMQTASWVTGGKSGEGIWAPGGLASDGTALFGITGNATGGTPDTHADSEEVVRVTGMASVQRDSANLFWPKIWKQMDQTDADFGSNSPVYFQLPGGMPSALVAAPSKDGHLYFLDPSKLGGEGGELFDLTVSATPDTILWTAPIAYQTAAGTFVAESTRKNAKCPTGGGRQAIQGIRVTAGPAPKAEVAWCSDLLNGPYSPIATTTDGKSESIVWYITGNKLMGVEGDTGKMVYYSAETCPNVERWTSPIAVKGRIVVGANGRLCAFGP